MSDQIIKLEELKNDFFNQMKEVWEEKSCCDVTIIVGKEKFPCHRLILSLASSYFKKLFYGDFKEKNTDEIILHEVDVQAFKTILNSIYTGEMELNSDLNLYQILKVSSYLNVKAVENACVSYILERDDQFCNMVEICVLAKIIGQFDLFHRCINIIAEDLFHFSKVDAFKNLSFDILKLILSQVGDKFDQNEESVVVLALIQWNKFNEVSIDDIEVLLKSAKFNKINSAVMAKLIQSADDEFVHNGSEENKKLKLNVKHCSSDDETPKLIATASAIEVKSSIRGIVLFVWNEQQTEWILYRFYPYINVQERKVNTGIINAEAKWYILLYNRQSDSNIFINLPLNENRQFSLKKNRLNNVLERPPITLKNCKALVEKNRIFFFSLDSNIDNTMQILIYDCDSDTWTTDISPPSDMKISNKCPIAKLRSKIFIFGVEKISGEEFGSSFVGCFDCERLCFSIISTMPFLHDDGAACVHDGKIYLCGSSHNESWSKHLSIFDAQTLEFLSLKQMNIDRAKTHQLIYYNQFLYVLDHQPFKELERYNIALNQWFRIPSLPWQVFQDDHHFATGKFAGAVVFKRDDEPVFQCNMVFSLLQ